MKISKLKKLNKIIALLIISLLLFSCKKEVIINKDIDILTYPCDMSKYEGLTSTDHNFVGTTVSELKKVIIERGSAAFVLSRESCNHCQMAMQYLNEVAKELGVTVYYLDGESDVYPIVDTPDYNLLDALIKPIEEENEDGEMEPQTPHFFTVINGDFKDSYIGFDFKGDEPTDKEIDMLKLKYRKALKIFAQE